MAYDERLAERLRSRLARHAALTEKRMFGGLALLLNGNMCCGVHQQEMIVRLDPALTQRALREPHTRIFDLSGRAMRGWILIGPHGWGDDATLAGWLQLATTYAESLPPK
jgi:hypothetical protein